MSGHSSGIGPRTIPRASVTLIIRNSRSPKQLFPQNCGINFFFFKSHQKIFPKTVPPILKIFWCDLKKKLNCGNSCAGEHEFLIMTVALARRIVLGARHWFTSWRKRKGWQQGNWTGRSKRRGKVVDLSPTQTPGVLTETPTDTEDMPTPALAHIRRSRRKRKQKIGRRDCSDVILLPKTEFGAARYGTKN
jgi:hypothetical protein